MAALAGAGVVALSLPDVLARGHLSPDAIEYLAIANAWVHGAGFVDPILYSFFLGDVPPPVPALVVRAPVVSVLLSLPLSLGASLPGVLVAHLLLAAGITSFATWLACRWSGPVAGLVFAVGFAWSYPWLLVARVPVTEVAACGAVAALAALARAAAVRVSAAVAMAIVLVVGWLTRPNLALLGPAFAVAAFLPEWPARLRRAAPWVAWLGFFGVWYGVVTGFDVATGYRPYQHYGVLLETLSAEQASEYGRAYDGVLAFLRSHGPAVARVLEWNASEVAALLFVRPTFHGLGWLALPTLVLALRSSRSPGREHRTFLALGALGLLAVTLASWGAVDPLRLLVPSAFCLWLLVACILAELGRRWGAVYPAAPVAPVALVLAIWMLSPSAGSQVRGALASVALWRTDGTASAYARSPYRALCPDLPRTAVVASPDPWQLHLVCGNAARRVPPDLPARADTARFLTTAGVEYLVIEAAALAPWRASDLVDLVAIRGDLALLRVAAPIAPPRWSGAPPPLAPDPSASAGAS